MERINLIPASRRNDASARRRLRLWIGSACGYAGVIAIMVLTSSLLGHNNVAAEMENGYDTMGQNPASLKPQIEEAQAQLQASRAIAEQADWSLMLALLGKLADESVTLDRCRLDPAITVTAPGGTASNPQSPAEGAYTVLLTGSAKSQPAVLQFVLRLEDCGLFSHVNLIRSDRSVATAGSRVAFRIECALGGGKR